MRLIDADGVIEEIKRNKLLAREPATVRCMEVIKDATTYVEPSRKWIPVEERSPEKNATYYLVATMRSPRVEMAWYLDGEWFWNNSDSRMGDVVAWMPLPESYRPEPGKE